MWRIRDFDFNGALGFELEVFLRLKNICPLVGGGGGAGAGAGGPVATAAVVISILARPLPLPSPCCPPVAVPAAVAAGALLELPWQRQLLQL